MERFRAAARTARTLLSSGLLGADLGDALKEAYPHLTLDERKKVARLVRQEVGILGQVALDPSVYSSCNKARMAKQKHPNRHMILATYRTPMCSTCDYQRSGSCTLIGGKLIAGPQDLTEEAVSKTASILVQDHQVTSRQATRIATAEIPADRRVAALHLSKVIQTADPTGDTKARAASKRVAAILDQTGTDFKITLAPTTGAARTRNAESKLDAEAAVPLPGDQKVEARARKAARILQPLPMLVDLPGEAKHHPVQVKIAASSVFDVPEMRTAAKRTDVDEEALRHIQVRHDQLIRTAARMLGRGAVDLETATRLSSTLETLQLNGARPSRTAARIKQQLEVLSGALEM